MVAAMFHLAAAGRPLHHDFADKTAAVDGEMVDVVGLFSEPKCAMIIRRRGRRRSH